MEEKLRDARSESPHFAPPFFLVGRVSSPVLPAVPEVSDAVSALPEAADEGAAVVVAAGDVVGKVDQEAVAVRIAASAAK